MILDRHLWFSIPYKLREACGDYYEFTVNRLLNYNIDSDGISPMQIFGIEEDEMVNSARTNGK